MSYNRRKLLPVLFLLFPLVLQAQKQGPVLIDSLKRELATAKEDTNKVIILSGISFLSYSSDPEAGIKYGEEALALAEKLHWKKGIGSAYNSIGTNYMQQSNNEKALEYFQRSLKINEETGNKIRRAQNLGNIGLVYSEQSDYPRALEYMFKALKICEETDDKKDRAKQLGNIGDLYHAEKNYLLALHYDSLALQQYNEIDDKDGEAIGLGNLGNVYNNLGDYEKALTTYTGALKMSQEQGKKKSIGINLVNIGDIYREEHNYTKALDFQFKALTIFNELGALNLIGKSFSNIGSCYLEMARSNAPTKTDQQQGTENNYLQTSISYFQKAIAIEKKTNDLNSLADDLLNLSNAQKMGKNYSDALDNYGQHVFFRDSVFNTKNKTKINNLEHQRELELKESQIKILAQENKLKDLNAGQEQLTRRILMSGIILLIIFVLSVVMYYVRRQRHEKLIANERINTLLKEQEIKSMNNMLEVQELERKRIAADLHDRLGSMLSTVKLYFNLVEEQIDKVDGQNKDQYHKATWLLDEACNEVRKISHDLVSSELVKFGLVSALNQMKQTIEITGKLKVNVLSLGMKKRLESSLEITLYRIMQELMNNVMKHANACEVTIQLNKAGNNLNIVVEDNGTGFDVDNAMANDGMGLKNIETRVKKLKGIVSIDSGKGRGTTTIIDIPV